ncbi:hypothetical protein ACFYXH_08900 [Streptomyces sp. NPDC002730]|uniref:hypothetical protein n=1 Tax=Streptomyces sp. NPDC002730 TaxID=3364662 RepID=UPI003675FA5B
MAGRTVRGRRCGVLVSGVLAAALMLTGCGGGGEGESAPPRGSAGADGGEWSSGPDSGGPTWNPSDNDGAGGSGNGGGGNGGGKDKDAEFAWLPPGPDSPNTNVRIDPEDVYDKLWVFNCSGAGKAVAEHSTGSKQWKLVHALTLACLAAKGDTAQWNEAVRLYDSLHGPGFTYGDCRDTAAYRMLKQVVNWHRQYPRGKVTLHRSSGDTTACPLGITAVVPGPEVVLKPPYWGFRVEGTWRSEVMNVDLEVEGAKLLTLEPRHKQCCEGAAVSFELPESFTGAGLVDLTLHFEGGGSMTKHGAIRIDGSANPGSGGESPDPNSPSPESPSPSFFSPS